MKMIKFILSSLMQTIFAFISLNLILIIATLKSSYMRYPNNPKIKASIHWEGKDE